MELFLLFAGLLQRYCLLPPPRPQRRCPGHHAPLPLPSPGTAVRLRRCSAKCPGCRGTDPQRPGAVWPHSQGPGVVGRDRMDGQTCRLPAWLSAAATTGCVSWAREPHLGTIDGVTLPPGPRAPPSLALFSSPRPHSPGQSWVPFRLPPDPKCCCCLCLHHGPCQPSGNPLNRCHNPPFPQAPSGFLLPPSPMLLATGPYPVPQQGHVPGTGVSPAQSLGCRERAGAISGAPWQRPPRGQPRPAFPACSALRSGPGPTGTSAPHPVLRGTLGALWTVGQSRRAAQSGSARLGVGRVSRSLQGGLLPELLALQSQAGPSPASQLLVSRWRPHSEGRGGG